MYEIYIGFALAILAAIGFNLCVVFHTFKEFMKCKIWIFGTLLGVGGWLLYFLALGMAPLSIIQPVLGFGMVVLALCAVFYLKESLKLLEWVAVIIVTLGVIMIGCSITPDRERAAVAIATHPLLLVTVLTIALAILSAAMTRIKKLGIGAEVSLGICCGFLFGTGAIYTKAMAVDISTSGSWILTDLFLSPYPYGVVGFNAIGFIVLQGAFQRGRALIVTPVGGGLGTLIPVVGGVIVFGEMFPQEWVLSTLRITGLAIIIIGTVMLSRLRG
jgi:drug/metabolite transporter (DMT)-like permease